MITWKMEQSSIVMAASNKLVESEHIFMLQKMRMNGHGDMI